MILLDKKTGKANLSKYLSKADGIDWFEGRHAYQNYQTMLMSIADEYEFNFDAVVAGFCALSPNNDYVGNLRSLVSVLDGLNRGIAPEHITVSTYNHCKERAIKYILRQEQFHTPKRGLKILNFYYNILYPESKNWATIDGHMAAAFQGDGTLTMKEVMLTKGKYNIIKEATQDIAWEAKLLPNQVQAIIWFVRKRVYGIKYDANFDLFDNKNDSWRIIMPLDEIKPYGTTLERQELATPETQTLSVQMQQTLLPSESHTEKAPE